MGLEDKSSLHKNKKTCDSVLFVEECPESVNISSLNDGTNVCLKHLFLPQVVLFSSSQRGFSESRGALQQRHSATFRFKLLCFSARH